MVKPKKTSLKQQESNLGTSNKRINGSPLLSIDHTKDGMGRGERQSYSQGWQSYNQPQCLSVGTTCSLPFSFTGFMKKKKPHKALFTVSLSSLWHFLSHYRFSSSLHPPLFKLYFPPYPPLPPFVGWLSLATAHYSSWQWQPPFLPLTHKLQIPNFQMHFISMKWRSPFILPLNCLSGLLFGLTKLYWHNSVTKTPQLSPPPLLFLCVSHPLVILVGLLAQH